MDKETADEIARLVARVAVLEAGLAASRKKPAPIEGNVISARTKATRLGVSVSTVKRRAVELGGRRRFGQWIFPE